LGELWKQDSMDIFSKTVNRMAREKGEAKKTRESPEYHHIKEGQLKELRKQGEVGNRDRALGKALENLGECGWKSTDAHIRHVPHHSYPGTRNEK